MPTPDNALTTLTQPQPSSVGMLSQDPYAGMISAWLAEVQRRTNSQRTPGEYSRYLERFRLLVPDLFSAQPAHLHAFAYSPGPSGRMPSASTITVRLSALRSFYDFARRMRLIASNPADDVKRPKSDDPAPRGLTADELGRLLAAIPATNAGLRDRAVIETMIYTGLRRTEVLTLTAGQLERDGERVFYRVRAKGGVERFRRLPPPAVAAIARYWATQGQTLEQLADEALLFPISQIGFYANLRRYADRAGLSAIKPHDLRHSAAKLRRQSGASIEDVQTLLGHKSIATTAIYLNRLEGSDDEGWQAVETLLGDRQA